MLQGRQFIRGTDPLVEQFGADELLCCASASIFPARSLPGAARASAAVKLHLLTDLRPGDRESIGNQLGLTCRPGVIAQVWKG